jgi:hypothetical protein
MTVKVLLEGEPVGGIVDQQKWICQQIEDAGGEVWFMYNDDAADVHDRYNYQHGKWMIIDGQKLPTGSESLNRSAMPHCRVAECSGGPAIGQYSALSSSQDDCSFVLYRAYPGLHLRHDPLQ